MNKLQEMADALAKKRETVKSLLGKADATQEELARVDTLIAEIEREDAELKTAERRARFAAENEAALKALNAPATPVAHPEPSPENKLGATKAYTEQGRGRIAGLKHFKSEEQAYRFGQWFLACAVAPFVPNGERVYAKSVEWAREHGLFVKAQNEQNNVDGGALVPQEFDTAIIDLRERFGVFRPNARVVPMMSDTKIVPRRGSGLTAYFVGDNDAITESQKGWNNVELVAKKIATLTKYSSEVAEDAIINMGDDLAGEIAYAFAEKEDQCGFNGDGTSSYGGIMGVIPRLLALDGTISNIAGLVVAAGNAYSEITLANFNAVVGRLPQYADTPNAAWYAHRTFYFEVMQKLELAAGGTTAMEVSQGNRRPRPLFLGYPVNFAQVLPKTEANDQVCCLFGDLALASRFGDRRQTTIAIDTSIGFANDQWAIRGTQRFDIVVHDVGNASATASARIPGPVVGLVTASS